MIRVEYIGAAWCAPCKVTKPRVQELCKKYGVELVEHYYDEMDEETKESVKKLPTVRVYADGDNTLTLEFITQQAELLEKWLGANVRVMATEDF